MSRTGEQRGSSGSDRRVWGVIFVAALLLIVVTLRYVLHLWSAR